MATRAEFLAAAKALEGTPYLWDGKAPSQGGLDCSGLVTWCLKIAGGPDLRATHNAFRLWLDLEPAVAPSAGDLAFYGPTNDPTHVVICLGGPHDRIIGANGGGRNTLTLEVAKAQKAMVKPKDYPGYRPDLLGFRSMTKYLGVP